MENCSTSTEELATSTGTFVMKLKAYLNNTEVFLIDKKAAFMPTEEYLTSTEARLSDMEARLMPS